MSEHSQPQLDEKETGRVEAFSDGVFAIAITLLILELKVPHSLDHAGLRRALLDQWPSYAAYFTSFATIGIMWINHHRLFTLIRRVDNHLLKLNGVLLLGVSVVPFPTALVAEYLGHDGEKLAAAVYCSTSVFIALGFWSLWRYAASARRKPRLLRVAPDHADVQAIHAQYRYGPLLYIAALGLALMNANAGIGACAALAVFFLLPPRAPKPD